jgi:hypothetical protein
VRLGRRSLASAPRFLTVGLVLIGLVCVSALPAPGLAAAQSGAGYGPTPVSLFSPLVVPAGAASPVPVHLVLNVAACQLYVYLDGSLAHIYPTTVGRVGEPTPTGLFSILSKRINPTWYPSDRPPVPPGPSNPLGTRWMGFAWRGHGLHGNNAPWLIGQPGSAGCVRLHNRDAEALFEMVRIGTPLRVVYEPVELADYRLPADPMAEEDGPPADGSDDEVLVTETGPAPGGFVLALFPDIYHRVADYQEHLTSKLALAGRPVAPEMAAWLTGALETHGSVTWDTASPVYYRGQLVDTDIIRLGRYPENPALISVEAFAGALGLGLEWDEELGLPTLDGRPVEDVVVAAGRVYAGLESLARAAARGIEWAWDVRAPEPSQILMSQSLSITARCPVYINRYALSERALDVAGETYVPIRVVAAALGLPLTWDPDLCAVMFLGRELPVRIVAGTGFVRAQDLAAALAGFLMLRVADDGVYIFR